VTSFNEMNERTFGRLLHVGGIVVVLVIVAAFCLLVYQPLIRQREEHATRLEQLDMLLTRAGAIQNEHRQLRHQLTTMQEAVSRVHDRIPSEGLEDEFVDDLGRIASEVGVEIDDPRLAPENQSATHSEVAVSVRGYGSYAGICRFLQSVDQLARITKVAQIELGSRENSTDYRFRTTFILYYGVPTHDIHDKRRVL